MRHVLRYQQHDILLSTGRFVIGRADTCQLSLDDPLVSRQHALLTIDDESVTVEDLGSRNGVKVNGELVAAPRRLSDRDQLSIGSQGLVYIARRENAGATLVQPASDRGPAFGLLGILADKAFALGKPDEAERLLTEVLEQVLTDLEMGREVKPELFDRATGYAMRLAGATGNARWVEYVFKAFGSLKRPCPAGIVDQLYSLVRKVERVNLGVLRTYIEILRGTAGALGPAERFLVGRLEGLERLLAAM